MAATVLSSTLTALAGPAAAPPTACPIAERVLLRELGCELDKTFGSLGADVAVAIGPVKSDRPVEKLVEFSARLGRSVATRRRRPGVKLLGAPTLVEARALAKNAKLLVFVTPEIVGGELRATADEYPVIHGFWDRVRSPAPDAVAHAFATRRLDGEVASFLPKVPLVTTRTDRSPLPSTDVVALTCGASNAAGGLELVSVGRRKIQLGQRPKRCVRAEHGDELVDLVARCAEPTARADRRGRPRARATRRGRLDRTAPRAFCCRRRLPRSRSSAAKFLSPGSAVSFEPASLSVPRRLALPGRAPDERRRARRHRCLREHDDDRRYGSGTDRRRVPKCERPHRHAPRRRGTYGTRHRSGAALALGDVNVDGEPELITSLDTLNPAEDRLVVSSWGSDGAMHERLRVPAPDGVHAIAACPGRRRAFAHRRRDGDKLVDLSTMKMSRRAFIAAAIAARHGWALGRKPSGGVLRLELPFSIDAVDPHSADDAASALLAPAIADPLYGWDTSFRPYPALAAGMPEPVADGARITLRPGLVTARGHALDARDVIASLERARARAARPLLSGFGAPRLVPSDALALVVPHATPDALAEALASPVTAIVPRGFTPEDPDGTGAFRATRTANGLTFERNERAARGPSFLDRIEVRRASRSASALRGFESGDVDVGWLGAGLHRRRPGAVDFRAEPVGFIVLHTGPLAGNWGTPGIAERLVTGMDRGRFAYLGLLQRSTGRGDTRWGGPPVELLVDQGSPYLVEVANVVAAVLSAPSHEIRPTPLSQVELRSRRSEGRYALAIEVVRLLGRRRRATSCCRSSPRPIRRSPNARRPSRWSTWTRSRGPFRWPSSANSPFLARERPIFTGSNSGILGAVFRDRPA